MAHAPAPRVDTSRTPSPLGTAASIEKGSPDRRRAEAVRRPARRCRSSIKPEEAEETPGGRAVRRDACSRRFAHRASVGMVAGARPVTQAGRYGPFYRTGATQDRATTNAQLASRELWGKANRGANQPSVDAWVGPLPAGRDGIEFWTDVPPSPGSPPDRARWLGPRPGVRIEGQWAKITATITSVSHKP